MKGGLDPTLARLAELLENTADRDRHHPRGRRPRETVFDAMTDPKQVVQWWGPRGFTTTIREMDVRVGGVWSHTMHGPDGKGLPQQEHLPRGRQARARRLLPRRRRRRPAPRSGRPDVRRQDRRRLTLKMVFPSVAVRNHVVKKYNAIEGGNQNLTSWRSSWRREADRRRLRGTMAPDRRTTMITRRTCSKPGAIQPHRRGSPAWRLEEKIRLGVASYSLRNLKRPQAIEAVKACGVTYVNIKSVHLTTSLARGDRGGPKEFDDAASRSSAAATKHRGREGHRPALRVRQERPLSALVIAPKPELPPRDRRGGQEERHPCRHPQPRARGQDVPAPSDALKLIKNMDPRVGLPASTSATPPAPGRTSSRRSPTPAPACSTCT